MCYSAKWASEIRQIDHRQQQASDPENLNMGEHGEQAQDGDDLILHLLMILCDVFRQVMQSQEQNAKAQGEDQQYYSHHNQEHVGLPRFGDEPRQIY